MYGYLEYLPDHLKDFEEYIALEEATKGNVGLAQNRLVQIYMNQFIEYADLDTIGRWEKIFKVQNTNPNLDLRRQQVIAYFNMRAPITVNRLKTIIENITQCKCDISVKHSEYRFEIIIINANTYINFPLIFSQVHKLKPANMLFDVTVETQVEIGIKVNTEQFKYGYSLTGNHKVGTIPIKALVGCIRELNVNLNAESQGYVFGYEMAGTKPYDNTIGVITSLDMDLDPEGTGYLFKYEKTGTEPYENTKGVKSESDYVPEIQTESFNISYRRCGTSNTRR